MRIAMDVDNVTLDLHRHWVQLYEDWFGVTLDPAKLDTWSSLVDATHFEDMTEFFEWFEWANGWETQPFLPGARGGLDALRTMGVDITWCTACPEAAQPSRKRLLSPWSNKFDFLNHSSKHLTLADVWVDDSPEVLKSLKANRKNTIRFVKPWNKGSAAMCHVKDWHELVKIVKGLI